MALSDSRIKADWDARARARDLQWLDTRATTHDEFDTTGREDAACLLADIKPFVPPGGLALEIGCGPGRLMPPMADYFQEVWGTDASAEMIRMAQRRIGHLPGVTLLETSGSHLDGVPSAYFDFCYSAFTLEVIGDPDIVAKYIGEARRILKPGGLFKFQVKGLYPGNPFRPFYEARKDTWFGEQFTVAEITRLTEATRFEVLAAFHARHVARPHEDGSLSVEHRIWVVARKGTGMDEWEEACWNGGRALFTHCPPGAQVTLPDHKMADLLGAAAGGTVRFLPFDPPADSTAAIAALEAFRAQGGRHLFLSKYKFWWMDHYGPFFEYLDRRYKRVEQTQDYLLVALEGEEG